MLPLELLLTTLLAQAQASAPEERVRVDYVLVEVVARDGRDRLITDLTLDDFVLRENGKKVALESLDILDLRGNAAEKLPAAVVQAAGTSGAAIPRLRGSRVLLAVDFQFADHTGVNEAFRGLEEYLEGTARHTDLSYLLYSLEGGDLMGEFDSDPAVVLEALRTYRTDYWDRKQGLRRDEEANDIRELERRFMMCSGPYAATCIRDELQSYLAVQNGRTETVMRELESLVERFPDDDSFRTLVFISPGFSLHPGSAGVQMASILLGHGRDPSLAGRVGGRLPGTVSFEDRMRDVAAACARNHVVFHAFDIYNADMVISRKVDASVAAEALGGVLASYDTYRRNLQGGMKELTRDTGGVFHVYLDKMRPVLEGDRFVYVLGYTRPPSDTPTFRKIKVKCKRGGIRLRHRPAYTG